MNVNWKRVPGPPEYDGANVAPALEGLTDVTSQLEADEAAEALLEVIADNGAGVLYPASRLAVPPILDCLESDNKWVRLAAVNVLSELIVFEAHPDFDDCEVQDLIGAVDLPSLANKEKQLVVQVALIDLAAELSESRAEHIACVIEAKWIDRINAALADAKLQRAVLDEAWTRKERLFAEQTTKVSAHARAVLERDLSAFDDLNVLIPKEGAVVRAGALANLCVMSMRLCALVRIGAPDLIVSNQRSELEKWFELLDPEVKMAREEAPECEDPRAFLGIVMNCVTFGRRRVGLGAEYNACEESRRFLANVDSAPALETRDSCYAINPARSFWLSSRIALPHRSEVSVGHSGGPLTYARGGERIEATVLKNVASELTEDQALVSFVWLDANEGPWDPPPAP